MPLAEYLQIHPAGAECPAGANYFLNLEGVAIESSPSFGKKPEPKNMTLFGFRKEDDMDEHWCVSTFPAVFLLALAHPPENAFPVSIPTLSSFHPTSSSAFVKRAGATPCTTCPLMH